MKTYSRSLFAAVFILAGCVTAPSALTAQEAQTSEAAASMPVEATSFLGEPLYRKPASPEKAAAAEEALARLEASEELSEDDYIEIGGTVAGAGRYQDAIAAYSQGIADFEDSYKLRRHRAHRYITTRQLEKAYDDLKEAEALVKAADAESVYEYKGGHPHGTYAHWIQYHIGIYHYLNGDFANSAEAFEGCVKTSEDNDTLIGSVDWLYNAYLRNGQPDKASAVLELVDADIEADETYPYYKRVMMYKGVVSTEDVIDLSTPESWDGRDATVAYGVASGMIADGDDDAARSILKGVLNTSYWPIWAYVSAERDYARLVQDGE
ncbi:tetratricopeptide repeat protein [Henriciella aquimarina]|uniref:tetratricopeptide repeat protein n=1 Tax=Henriciella aquimarina TaxID=545261 RepID=UPI000A003A53|nr:hypothetical protein [Henriciella aquimarina]